MLGPRAPAAERASGPVQRPLARRTSRARTVPQRRHGWAAAGTRPATRTSAAVVLLATAGASRWRSTASRPKSRRCVRRGGGEVEREEALARRLGSLATSPVSSSWGERVEHRLGALGVGHRVEEGDGEDEVKALSIGPIDRRPAVRGGALSQALSTFPVERRRVGRRLVTDDVSTGCHHGARVFAHRREHERMPPSRRWIASRKSPARATSGRQGADLAEHLEAVFDGAGLARRRGNRLQSVAEAAVRVLEVATPARPARHRRVEGDGERRRVDQAGVEPDEARAASRLMTAATLAGAGEFA